MAKLAEQVYSSALFQLAKEEDVLEIVEGDMKSLMEVLDENPEFFEFLRSPVIAKSTKKKVFDDLFKEEVHPVTFNFIQVVIDKNRAGRLKEIGRLFVKECNKEHQIIEAIVESAIALSEEEVEKIVQLLSEKSGKNVLVTQKVNPEILGGLRIQMGNRIMDASLQTGLKAIRNRIYQTIV